MSRSNVTVLRTDLAEQDLTHIWRSIADNNPSAADRQLERIDAAFARISRHPEIGTRRPDLARNPYMVVVGSYLVFYHHVPGSDDVTILRVLHGSRDIENIIL